MALLSAGATWSCSEIQVIGAFLKLLCSPLTLHQESMGSYGAWKRGSNEPPSLRRHSLLRQFYQAPFVNSIHLHPGWNSVALSKACIKELGLSPTRIKLDHCRPGSLTWKSPCFLKCLQSLLGQTHGTTGMWSAQKEDDGNPGFLLASSPSLIPCKAACLPREHCICLFHLLSS